MDICMSIFSPAVGLARAAQGNRDLVTEHTEDLLIRAMKAIFGPEDGKLVSEIREERKRIVPDCFVCRNPCGQNDELDPEAYFDADGKILEFRKELLSCGLRIAEEGKEGAAEKVRRILFSAGLLFWGEDRLSGLIDEMK